MRLQARMQRRSQLTLPFDARSELHKLRRSASPLCAAPTLVAALLAVVTAAPLRAETLESPDAYEIVAAATVPVLPQPIRGFLEAHVEAVRQGVRRNRPEGRTGQPLQRSDARDVHGKRVHAFIDQVGEDLPKRCAVPAGEHVSPFPDRGDTAVVPLPTPSEFGNTEGVIELQQQ